MTQPAYAKTYPFDAESGQQANAAEWRRLAGAWGDGIVNDLTGNSFAVVPASGARTLTITLDELRLRGIHFEGQSGSSPLTVTLPAGPASGYTRADRVVAHYDPSDKSITVVPIAGTAVNTGAGTETPPALTQNSGGVWEMPLWRFTGGNVAAASLTKLDERQWLGESYVVPQEALLPLLFASTGSVAYALDTGHQYRLLRVSGSLQWVDMDGPNWQNISLAGAGALQASPSAQMSLAHGVVTAKGRISRVSGAPLISASTSTDNRNDPLLFTFPSGMRPASIRGGLLMEVGGTSYARWRVDSSGQCLVYADGRDIAAVDISPITFAADGS